MDYILCYDLETTGLKHQDDEIVQFSAIVLNMQLEEVETINIFHATPVSDYILKLHGKTQEFYDTNGTDKATFVENIQAVFKKYNFKYIMGHNIIGFDNRWLDHHTNINTQNYISVDTMKIEQKLLNCDDYGNLLDENGQKIYLRDENGNVELNEKGYPNTKKVKRTLKDSCLRRGVEFNEDEAHDGLYDCTKTLELYKKHKEIKNNGI